MEINEINTCGIISAHRFAKIIGYMNKGLPVKINGSEYMIAETFSGGFGIVKIMCVTNTLDKTVKRKVFGVPFEFFINELAKMTEEDMLIICANFTLNTLKK